MHKKNFLKLVSLTLSASLVLGQVPIAAGDLDMSGVMVKTSYTRSDKFLNFEKRPVNIPLKVIKFINEEDTINHFLAPLFKGSSGKLSKEELQKIIKGEKFWNKVLELGKILEDLEAEKTFADPSQKDEMVYYIKNNIRVDKNTIKEFAVSIEVLLDEIELCTSKQCSLSDQIHLFSTFSLLFCGKEIPSEINFCDDSKMELIPYNLEEMDVEANPSYQLNICPKGHLKIKPKCISKYFALHAKLRSLFKFDPNDFDVIKATPLGDQFECVKCMLAMAECLEDDFKITIYKKNLDTAKTDEFDKEISATDRLISQFCKQWSKDSVTYTKDSIIKHLSILYNILKHVKPEMSESKINPSSYNYDNIIGKDGSKIRLDALGKFYGEQVEIFNKYFSRKGNTKNLFAYYSMYPSVFTALIHFFKDGYASEISNTADFFALNSAPSVTTFAKEYLDTPVDLKVSSEIPKQLIKETVIETFSKEVFSSVLYKLKSQYVYGEQDIIEATYLPFSILNYLQNQKITFILDPESIEKNPNLLHAYNTLYLQACITSIIYVLKSDEFNERIKERAANTLNTISSLLARYIEKYNNLEKVETKVTIQFNEFEFFNDTLFCHLLNKIDDYKRCYNDFQRQFISGPDNENKKECYAKLSKLNIDIEGIIKDPKTKSDIQEKAVKIQESLRKYITYLKNNIINGKEPQYMIAVKHMCTYNEKESIKEAVKNFESLVEKLKKRSLEPDLVDTKSDEKDRKTEDLTELSLENLPRVSQTLVDYYDYNLNSEPSINYINEKVKSKAEAFVNGNSKYKKAYENFLNSLKTKQLPCFELFNVKPKFFVKQPTKSEFDDIAYKTCSEWHIGYWKSSVGNGKKSGLRVIFGIKDGNIYIFYVGAPFHAGNKVLKVKNFKNPTTLNAVSATN